MMSHTIQLRQMKRSIIDMLQEAHNGNLMGAEVRAVVPVIWGSFLVPLVGDEPSLDFINYGMPPIFEGVRIGVHQEDDRMLGEFRFTRGCAVVRFVDIRTEEETRKVCTIFVC